MGERHKNSKPDEGCSWPIWEKTLPCAQARANKNILACHPPNFLQNFVLILQRFCEIRLWCPRWCWNVCVFVGDLRITMIINCLNQLPVTPYCGCACDRLAAGIWCALLAVGLWGLVHVELMLADGGLDSAVVLRRCRVWMRVGVWMWMGVWGCELSGEAVLGWVCKLGWWISLGHGWIRGCRCVLVTLWRHRDSEHLCHCALSKFIHFFQIFSDLFV